MTTPTKAFWVRFQVTAENGKPLGPNTYVDGDTEVELREKLINIYTEAVRAMHRFRVQRDEARRQGTALLTNIQHFRKSTEV